LIFITGAPINKLITENSFHSSATVLGGLQKAPMERSHPLVSAQHFSPRLMCLKK
jgi:hypothetical protein